MKRLLLTAFCLLIPSVAIAQVDQLRGGSAVPSSCVATRNSRFYRYGVGWYKCVNGVYAPMTLSELLGITPEDSANRRTSFQVTPDDAHYPTEKLVKDSLDLKQTALGFTPENVANRRATFQVTPDDSHYPTEKLVKDSLDLKADTSALAPIATSGSASDLAAGTVPLARLLNLTNAEIAAGAGISWSKISKTGSSLADLTTRSAADLSSGELADARLSVNVPRLNSTQTWTAAQTMPVIDKGGQVFNAKAYGALGNGVAEEQGAINAAAAAASAAGGGFVYAPRGTYLIGAMVTFPANVHLIGDGPGVTIFKRKASFTGALLVTASGSVFESFTIDGNYPARAGGAGVDLAIRGDRPVVRNVKVVNSYYIGADIDANHALVEYCNFAGPGVTTEASYAIWATNVTSLRPIIRNSTFTNWSVAAVYGGASDMLVESCFFLGNHAQTTPTGGGQIAKGGVGRITIRDCYVGTGGGAVTSGIEADNSNWLIEGNTIVGQQNMGVFLQSGTGYVIKNNTVSGSGVADFSSAIAQTAWEGSGNTPASMNSGLKPRESTVASSTTPTPNADTADLYTITAQAAGATFGAPTGTPVQGQLLNVRIKDNGTARTLSWNAIYRATPNFVLPTTTAVGNTLYVQFVYNSTDSKWDLVNNSDPAYAGGAWTTFVPTVTSQTGAFTTLGTVSARYKLLGKLVFFHARIPIVTNGTAGTAVRVTLPYDAAVTGATEWTLPGAELAVLGRSLRVNIDSTTSPDTLQITNGHDSSYPGADGHVLDVTGFYERN